ncbi:MAG: glycosyltransferase family 2 protein [Cyanobacteria bacterium P01_A01_bin.114]
MSDFVETMSPDLASDFLPYYGGRRVKAALVLSTLWGGTGILHWVAWGPWMVLGFTVFMGLYLMRLIVARPARSVLTQPQISWLPSVRDGSAAVKGSRFEGSRVKGNSLEASDAVVTPAEWPFVSVLIAAKNEEGVIAALAQSLCQLDYPQDRYDVWIIDDNSDDRTGELLDQLARQYGSLNVIHRGPDATGGKSGALNSVWPRTRGDVLAVFDADAYVAPDLLRHVVPILANEMVGAVQVRKAIENEATNFWTRGQQAEMALDSYYQQQRIAMGGIGELRGNGQFVRRTAIAQCGGWNEATITDDLDLTLQLHLYDWEIAFVAFPQVGEEGVTRSIALWHQRNRWAEGGYQRYLDYWRPIIHNRLGLQKTTDLFVFWVLQYMLPMVTVPDVIFAIAKHRLPLFGPLTTLAVSVSFWGMFAGIRRTQQLPMPVALLHTIRGTIYMLHWVVVMSTTTVRVAVRPKRLKWMKTVHGES